MRVVSHLLVLGSIVAFVTSPGFAQPPGTLRWLHYPTPPPTGRGAPFVAWGVDNSGQVVGSYYRYDLTPARQYAFLWTPNGWTELWEGIAYDVHGGSIIGVNAAGSAVWRYVAGTRDDGSPVYRTNTLQAPSVARRFDPGGRQVVGWGSSSQASGVFRWQIGPTFGNIVHTIPNSNTGSQRALGMHGGLLFWIDEEASGFVTQMGATGSATELLRTQGTPIGGFDPWAGSGQTNFDYIVVVNNNMPVDPLLSTGLAVQGAGGPAFIVYNFLDMRVRRTESLPVPPGMNWEDCFVTDVSADGKVIVGWGWYYNPSSRTWQTRAIAWFRTGFSSSNYASGYTAINLNDTYSDSPANPHNILRFALSVSPNGRWIVGTGGINPGYAWVLQLCFSHNGDVDNNGCVDDADLLAVLFAFGQSGSNLGRVDTNCDGTVDDADLLTVLFNFGRGC